RSAGPDLRLDRFEICLTELLVTRDRACFQKGLELPALRPAIVVGQVRGEGAHECPLLALRTQVRVDLPQWGFDLDARDPLNGLSRQARRDIDRSPLIEHVIVQRPSDEDDVDIADVVELSGT